MSSPRDLKVLNVNSTSTLREVFIDCDRVKLCLTSTRELLCIGSDGSLLTVASFLSPTHSQVIDLGSSITYYHFQDDKIHALTANDEIKLLSLRDGKWHFTTVFEYTGPGMNIAGFLPVKNYYVLGINNGFTTTIAFTVAPSRIQVLGFIDCLKESQKIKFAARTSQFVHGHTILLGTEDGHVYNVSDNSTGLVLLCDIQQPIVSIFCLPKHYIIVGEYGKIVRLDQTTKKVAVCFGPTSILDCSLSNEVIYIQSPDSFLYSLQLRKEGCDEEFSEDIKFSAVKFIRAFYVTEDSAVIFAESGTVYQTSLSFEGDNPKTKRSGSEVKPLLEEIHRKADELDEMNRLNAVVLNDLNQLSTALHLLGKDLSSKFPMDARSHSYACSEGKERLQIKLTNNSEWTFPPTHWSLQIFTNHKQQISSHLASEWKTGETIELLLALELEKSVFKSKLEAFLIFRIASPHALQSAPRVACAFPVNCVELGVLNFLEPTTKDQAPSSTTNCNDFIGFRKRIMSDNPWPVLLKRSWHRGLGQLLSDALPPSEIHVTYASEAIKFTLKEEKSQSTDVWILQIETTKIDLLRHIRLEMSQLVKDHRLSSVSDVVRIPSLVLSQLQSLRGRLNYVRSLKKCTEEDLKSLMEEIRLVFAKEFYIR